MTNIAPCTIVFEVGDYAYGSLTMALSVAAHLHGRYQIVCIAHTGVAKRVRESHDFTSTYEVSEAGVGSSLKSIMAREKVRLVCDFSVLNNDTWNICESSATPLLLFDMHLWRRSRSTIRCLSARANSPQLYFEAYPGIEDDLRRVGLTYDNVVQPVVGSLVDLPIRSEPKIIINLGGASSAYIPYYSNHYPTIILKMLKSVLKDKGHGYSVMVCCGEQMAEHIGQTDGSCDYPVVSLPRVRYLTELSTASLLITQPSIHSPYEGFLLSKPTILLPPQNFSQCFHLEQWMSCGIGCLGSNLPDLFSDLSLSPRGDEQPQEILVQNVLKRLATDSAKLGLLSDLYLKRLEAILRDPDECLRRQKGACEKLGWDSGAAQVSRLIETHAKGMGCSGYKGTV